MAEKIEIKVNRKKILFWTSVVIVPFILIMCLNFFFLRIKMDRDSDYQYYVGVTSIFGNETRYHEYVDTTVEGWSGYPFMKKEINKPSARIGILLRVTLSDIFYSYIISILFVSVYYLRKNFQIKLE